MTLMRTIKQLAVVAILALTGAITDLNAGRAAITSAEEILKQARQSLGGEDSLRRVQSLTAKGKYRRVTPDRDISGEKEFNFQLPDKFQRSESWLVGALGSNITMSRTLSGADSWIDNSAPSGGVIFMRDGQAEKPNKEQMEQMQKRQTGQLRAEFARYMLALLLNPPNDLNVQFSYAGEAVAEDGRADVIDASGADGFAARLFLNKETHLPLMLSYRAPKMRMMTVSRAIGHQGGADALKEARDKLSKETTTPGKAEEVEYQMHFEDYRKVGGLLLPHRITQSMDGELNEEWEITSYEINPQFKADKFQKK